MITEGSVSGRQRGLLADVLHLTDPRSYEPGEVTTLEVMRTLQLLLGCDAVFFLALDSYRHVPHYQAGVEDDDERFVVTAQEFLRQPKPEGLEVMMAHWWSSPCSLAERRGTPGVTSIRSWYSEREWAGHPLHTEYLQAADRLVLVYPVGSGRTLRIIAHRDESPPFGERELVLLELLLPHLIPLVSRTLRASLQEGTQLTMRQVQILELVRQGLPNKLIARSLRISEGTVRKHLEHTYARLGVHGRAEAVAVGLGPQHAPG